MSATDCGVTSVHDIVDLRFRVLPIPQTGSIRYYKHESVRMGAAAALEAAASRQRLAEADYLLH